MSDAAAVVVATSVVAAALLGSLGRTWSTVAGAAVATSAVVLVRAAAARRAPGVGPVAGLAFLVVAVVVAASVGVRAHHDASGLDRRPPGVVEGSARIVTDPVQGPFGTSAVVRVDGRHYWARADRRAEPALRRALVGEHLVVRGRTSDLGDAPRGWVLSRHLAGSLELDDVAPGAPAAPWYRAANAVHRTLSAGAGSLPEDRRALYLGMVIGDDRGQGEVQEFRFRAAGLTHLLAVSGQNVAFVLLVLGPVLRRLPRRARVPLSLLALAAFVLVTRADPSVLRASVMAAIGVAAIDAGRPVPSVRRLALAVVALVAADPLIVRSVGFQLSVAATFGVVALAPRLAARLRGPDVLRRAVAMTAAAQVSTAPLQLLVGWPVSAAAPVANVVAGPLAGAIMVLGLTVGPLAGLLRDPVGALLVVPADLAVRAVMAVARTASALPLAPLDAGRAALVALGVAVVLAGLALARSRGPTGRRTRPRGAVAAGAVLLVAGGVVVAGAGVRPHDPAGGPTTPAPGVRLWVGSCGGRILAVEAPAAPGGGLEGLWVAGVRAVDVLVVGRGAGAGRTAAAVEQQLSVRRSIRPRAAEGPREVVVGGARASIRGDPPTVELSGARCSLRP